MGIHLPNYRKYKRQKNYGDANQQNSYCGKGKDTLFPTTSKLKGKKRGEEGIPRLKSLKDIPI